LHRRRGELNAPPDGRDSSEAHKSANESHGDGPRPRSPAGFRGRRNFHISRWLFLEWQAK
jgi:hypothetical protein